MLYNNLDKKPGWPVLHFSNETANTFAKAHRPVVPSLSREFVYHIIRVSELAEQLLHR